ncbi:hypothetical protein [Flavobacterium sp. I3-2]|uniref:hypothetical protein n=1 Tax=Flavobacterium sp. I3-2 TaxID=2748319 RepID=UPI0015ADA600|nr:hypothetical protein [Flavobacterium sp. I3-2]
MKNYTLLIVLFCTSINLNDQFRQLEENSNWNKYQKVIEKEHPEKKQSWSFVYDLKNGKISVLKTYFDNELRSENYFSYYDKSNLEKIKMNGVEVKNKLKYDELGQLVAQNNIHFEYDNNGKLIRQYLDVFEEWKGKKGWSEKYIYDDSGSLIQLEKSTYLNKQFQIEIENYIYDDCKNIIQITRKSNPKRAYPIVIIGGETKNESDFYFYEYNSDCIWTKKYKLVNGDKALISERELIKV